MSSRGPDDAFGSNVVSHLHYALSQPYDECARILNLPLNVPECHKSVEGTQHPDRNAQFEHINARPRTASSVAFRSSQSDRMRS